MKQNEWEIRHGYWKEREKGERKYPVDPLTRIIGEVESGVVKELRFENGVDIQEGRL